MIINPQTALDNGWVTGITNLEKQLQPNAIDFPIDRLFSIDNSKPFIISEYSKTMRGGKEIHPYDNANGEKFWRLEASSVYDAMSNIHVIVPNDVAVTLVIRSTLNRNGIFLTSGLYDTGFNGSCGFAIHNRSGEAFIAPGTRVGQIMFWTADSSGKYAGQYNTNEGFHWTESSYWTDDSNDE